MMKKTTKTTTSEPAREARPRSRGQRGVALVLVLLTFGVLSVLAAEFARAMREDALSTVNYKLETTGHYIAVAAINEAILAMHTARADATFDSELDEPEEPGAEGDGEGGTAGRRIVRALMQGDGHLVKGNFGGVPYEVRAVDEGGKIAINRADQEVLHGILINLGYDEEVAGTVSDSILDWIDEDDAHRINGAEEDYYMALARPYPAKNAPMEAVEELLLVRGVTRQMFYGSEHVPGLREIFSVFSNSGRLNLRSVRPGVMIALSGIPEEEAGELGRRRRRDSEGVSAELQLLLEGSGLGTPRDSLPSEVTLEARVKDAAGRVVSHVGATVKIRNGFRAYRWYDSVFHEDD